IADHAAFGMMACWWLVAGSWCALIGYQLPTTSYDSPMRAILFDRFGDESVLHLGDVPPPPLGPDDLRIAVRATAVNRADLLQRQGHYPPPPGASEILGLECAGIVGEAGANVR